ncbi:MAG: diguanylate cyclase [Pyrinomonadaceae bacterium]|nr:diguanylate cyclase [Pyrinomonadaceae bacterium]
MTKKSLKSKAALVQEHPENAPPGWASVQHRLAASAGLSILLVDGRQPPALVVSDNNSICRALQSSPDHVSLCDPYCGDAHRRAMTSGDTVHYKCHAGLQCFAMPAEIANERDLAVIGGRAFVTGADYRVLVERLRAGDLKELLASDPLSNVIFAEPAKLDQLADHLQKAARQFKGGVSRLPVMNEMPAALRAPANVVAPQAPRLVAAAKSSSDLQREIDQLRGELEYRSHFAESLRHFLERISSTDPQETYTAILTNSKDLLLAERASLLVVDERSNELILKAGVGLKTQISEVARIRLGEGVAGGVLETGRALVVENIEIAGIKPAPAERRYKSKSFISYPIRIGGRTIGVLNVTDKTSGEKYDDIDLSLLEIIGPQVALALERAEWQERATEFQLMSITDPLTGLLNRRYLQERMNEEVNRSKRYDYPMSFLMIDIDDFKSYNDLNGHPAGDQALQITAHCLKVALRSADVACRYGGEEFGILLPHTPLNEASVIAERMRQRVAETVFPHGKSQPVGMVTISIGISTIFKNVDTPDRVIAAADRALYNAKRKGKNRIELYQET